ncbi:T9SS type A sorting domain-containing protein [Bacteroidota bacterium]
MKQLISTVLVLLAFSTSVVIAQQTREYASDEVSALLTDLLGAVDGDEFILTTPGDQGFYRIDSTSLEIHADITIRAADGLMVRPMAKLVYSQALKDAGKMRDYMVRIKADTSEFTLQGIELQGDTAHTKYAIRTAKLADVTGSDSYKDAAWDEDSVVQRYVMHLEDCDINGINNGSGDGRGIILYVGTRGSVLINNCTFSAIYRDGIDMYTDGTRTTANGPFQYVDSIVITNSTFNQIGREVILYRNSGEDASDPANKSRLSKIIIDHVTFNACGENSATDSYYPMRIDAPQVLISNSLFTNMDQKSYIIGSNENEASSVDYTEFWGVLKEGSAFTDVADAVEFMAASIGDSVWLDMHDPMYADADAGDFTLGATSTVLTLASDGLALGDVRWTPEREPQAREYAFNEVSTLLTDLLGAIDGDEFILTTPGDQGFYRIDSTSLEIHADITIRAADGLMVRPMAKLVYSQALKDAGKMRDYMVRIKADTSEFTLQGIELQGDTAHTKYAIRTAKLADVTGSDSYKDAAWDEDSVVQRYVMHLEDCDINGINNGSGDGRGIILYVGTRGSVLINNCTFSAIYRDGIDMYTDGTRTTANGPFQYVDSIVITNSTFNQIGREVILYRNSGEDASDPANKSRLSKIIIDHVTFNACGENSATDSYYPMRIDAPQVLISNSLFTNMDQKSYIIGSNENEASMVDYTEFWGVLKEGSAFTDVADAVEFMAASIGDSVWLDMHDPMYADADAGDFTLGVTSEVLTLASDGLALGDLRWTPEPVVISDDATLSDLTLGGTTVTGFAAGTITYDVELAAGTSSAPAIAGVATHPNATLVPTDAASLPGASTVVVTAEDGTTVITYTVNFTVAVALSDDATLSDLTLDGTTVTGFAAGTITYDVELPAGTTSAPAIAGVATDLNATVVPTDAASLPGASTVVVTAEDGTTVITYTVNLTVAVGVESAVFNGLRIYPNPATESFKVANCEGATIRIFSITGLEMFSKSYISNEESIQTSFDKGVYILQIDKDGSRISKKLVIK